MSKVITAKLQELHRALESYGESEALIVVAQLLDRGASSWEDYASQSPAHRAIKDWWAVNYDDVPGDYTPDYHSWTNWYMDHFNTDWSGRHQSPEEVLSIMKDEADQSFLGTVKEKGRGFLGKLWPFGKKKKKQVDSNPHTQRSTGLEGTDLLPAGSRSNLSSMGNVHAYRGVNIDNVTPSVKSFIQALGDTANELGAETPVITSGWRSYEDQARIMAKNWRNNGGLNGGLEYLHRTYKDKSYGSIMHKIFSTYGTGPEAMSYAVNEVKKHPTSHIGNVGRAIDLNPTRGIKLVLDTINNTGNFDMKVVDETYAAGPHYHVAIFGHRGDIA
jgi:hypothetical protein